MRVVWQRWIDFASMVTPLQQVIVSEEGQDRRGVVVAVDRAHGDESDWVHRGLVVFADPECLLEFVDVVPSGKEHA